MTTRQLHAAKDAANKAESNSLRGSIPHDSFMRQPQVSKITGLSKSSLYSLIAKGLFPKPIPLSERSVAFLAGEVFDFMDQRIAARDAGKVA